MPALLQVGVPLTVADTPVLADMALCLARIRQAEDIITRDGVLVDGKRGQGALVKNPALQVSREYSERLRKWFIRFGVSPIDRKSLDLTEEPEPEDQAVAEYFARGKGADSARPDGEGLGDEQEPEA